MVSQFDCKKNPLRLTAMKFNCNEGTATYPNVHLISFSLKRMNFDYPLCLHNLLLLQNHLDPFTSKILIKYWSFEFANMNWILRMNVVVILANNFPWVNNFFNYTLVRLFQTDLLFHDHLFLESSTICIYLCTICAN